MGDMKISSYDQLQQQIAEMESKAATTGKVDTAEIEQLRQQAVDYFTSVDPKFNDIMLNAKFNNLRDIINEKKDDGSNNAKWEQNTRDLDNFIQDLATPGGQKSSDQKAVGYKNDWDQTVGAGMGDKADASTAKKIDNFLNAHKDDISFDFRMRAKAMKSDIEAGKTVTKNDVANLGATRITKDSVTNASLTNMGSSDYEKNGAGIAYKGSNVPLPGELNELQKTQQVNYLANAKPPVYITSDNNSPIKYAMYDASGKKIALPEPATAPMAIGLADGNWYVANKDGVGKGSLTSKPDELPADTKFYDLNGAAAGTVNPRTDLKGKAMSTGTDLTFANHTKTSEDKDPTGKAHGIAGAKSASGTVSADVGVKGERGKNGQDSVVLKNEAGVDITPEDAKMGDYGIFQFKNGAKYVSTESGNFLITGDKAQNIATGEVVKASDVMDDFNKRPKDQQRNFGTEA